MKTHNSKLFKKAICILILILSMFLVIVMISGDEKVKKSKQQLDKYSSEVEDDDKQEAGNSNNDNMNKYNTKSDVEDKVTNILFLGIDKQENASDSIMILSLNGEKKTIKLVSIMRDAFVYQGEGMSNKINYAYHYGGAEGSISTINNIFNLNIKKYIKIDFDGFMKIVDYLAGISVNINEKEREYINLSCKNYFLKNCGDVELNGEQTLAYARTRKIDSDFERTERQRKVMKAIFVKFKRLEAYKYPEVLYEISKISQTNLSSVEVLKLGSIVFSCNENTLSEFRIPIDGTSSDNTEGVYHLDWNEEVNKNALNNFLKN